MILRYSTLKKSSSNWESDPRFRDILKYSRTEFENYPEGDVNEKSMQESQNRRREWETAATLAFSLGKISKEELYAKGMKYSLGGGKNVTDWDLLPNPLFHVTTAKSKVISEGLKTRRELQQNSGKGLGGGPSNFISFSNNLEIGQKILLSLKEARLVARNELSIPEMIEQAKKGVGAKRPWYTDICSYYRGGKPGSEIPTNLKGLEKGYESDFTSLPKESREGWEPNLETKPIVGGDGIKRYQYWVRPFPKEKISEINTDFYKIWSSYREAAGGTLDPLLFDTDSEGLANIPENEIGLLEFSPVPGAKGFKVSALGEWRTASGEAVKFVREVTE